MSAIRLARGFTGRDVVVKFAGCYHGHVDSLLAAAGSGRRHASPCPGTPGVPVVDRADTIVLPYNDRAAVEAAFAEHGDRIACLITEAAPGNMGVVPPEPGFNALPRRDLPPPRRAVRQRRGDDRLPGHPARAVGPRRRRRGLAPDLMTFGKVMGGGFPAAAFGGRADVMAQLAPGGAGLPGRHPVGEPGRHHRRPGHAAAGRPTRSTRTSTRPPTTIRTAASERADRGRACRTSCRPPAPCSRSSSPTTDAVRDFDDALAAGHRGVRRVLPRDARPRASTCRRRRTRRGSCPPPTTTAPCRPCSTPCPAAARAAAAARPGELRREPDARDTIVHLLRHGEVHNPDGRPLRPARRATTCPTSATQMAERVAETIGDRDIAHLRASPLERAQETAAPLAAARGLEIVTDERVIESANNFEGTDVRRRRQRAASSPSRLAAPLQPVQAVVGRALRRRRRPDDGRGPRRPRRGRAATRR